MKAMRVARSYLLSWLALGGVTHAAQAPGGSAAMRDLPDLPVPAREPAYLTLDPGLVGVGFKSKTEKWGARLNNYRGATPSLTLDYGTLLTESLGMGGNLIYQGDSSEALINVVLAPAQSMRLQLTAGERRDYGACPAPACGIPAQRSYLLGLKKFFDKRSAGSSVGLFAYDIEDGNAASAAANLSPLPSGLRGYILNLGLQPGARSRMELRHSWGELSYSARDSQPQQHRLSADGVKYTHYFDNCMQLQGRYGSSVNAGRLNVGIAKNQWSVSLSRIHSPDGDDASLRIGYAIPLGSGVRKAIECGPSNGRPFSPLVEAVSSRPAQLPRGPLSGMDGTEMADRIVGW